MRDYESVAKSLRCCVSDSEPCEHCNCELEECNPKTIMEIAADAIEELLAAVPKWVSVEERLPEPGGVVLTYNSLLGLQNYGIDLVLDGEWHFDKFTQWWMPLPEAPKEGTP